MRDLCGITCAVLRQFCRGGLNVYTLNLAGAWRVLAWPWLELRGRRPGQGFGGMIRELSRNWGRADGFSEPQQASGNPR